MLKPVPSRRRAACLALACLTMGATAASAAAQTPELVAPRPFEASYRLEIRGWPGATVRHTLSQEGLHWLSSMRFSIAVAKGEERSRFAVEGNDTRALLYSSSYSLLGVGDDYTLGEAELTALDRQTALFDLSRRVERAECTERAPCDITFLDHRGRDEHFQYYVHPETTVSVPAGDFQAPSVTLTDVEKPDRHIDLSFHPQWPGLILSAEYIKDGRRDTTLTLTRFAPQ
ncbi:hypothetical protein [Halomonas sp. GD1P12]|uniref:hypothetical protein n=1 Tax=Halomonas sp. GD1P12 TaxID=2982691 RepID=UPI0029643C86|nr:hypothetical protein [Halomonas sp. GD1P12]